MLFSMAQLEGYQKITFIICNTKVRHVAGEKQKRLKIKIKKIDWPFVFVNFY